VSDFPLLVKRVDELREAGRSTRFDIETYLFSVIEAPLPELAEEVGRLRAAQPDVAAAVAALIDGSRAAFWDRHPELNAALAALPFNGNPSPPLRGSRGPSALSIEALLAAAGFDAIPSPLSLDQLDQLLGALAQVAAGVDSIRRASLREGAIEKLRSAGVKSPASAVDAAFGASKREPSGKQGHALELADPTPSPDPVNGAALLDEIVSVFRKYVILPKFGAEAAALWTMHTYAVQEAFDFSPRLAVTGPTKRCGKSRLLEVLAGLVVRPLVTENISPAAMFRIVEQRAPTLLIDEGDTFLRDNEEMRGLLNAGQRRNGTVLRVVGEDLEPRAFGVFSAVAIACIGDLPDTVRDRAIAIPMRRRAQGEEVARLRLGPYRDEVATHRRKLMRWSLDNAATLKTSTPALPRGLDDRAADGWEPLLAIADAIGGAWSALAREAAVALSAGRADADDSKGILLLADLRELFDKSRADKLSSEEISATLATFEERPWSEWGPQRRAITLPQIARLLKPFGIASKNIRLSAEKVVKGYQRSDLEDAWSRYLPPPKRYGASSPGSPGEGDAATERAGSGAAADSSLPGRPGGRSGVAAPKPDIGPMRESLTLPPSVPLGKMPEEEQDAALLFDLDVEAAP
jgi:putative DNA primase/helicase